MTFNIISDLHCCTRPGDEVEWFGFEPEKLAPADYLIVAGDTGYAQNEHIIHRELREKTKGKFKAVLTIKGNHSYWVTESYTGEEIPEAYLTVMSPNDKIDLVDGDVAIIGTTLWTNRTTFNEIRHMNDYRHIPGFSPEIKEARFKEESEWLRAKWKEYKSQGKKVVIVTHHNPRNPNQIPELSWEHSDVSSAYWVMEGELDDIKPDLWICGHIHESFSGIIDDVRLERHPIGYRWGWFRLDPVKFPHQQSIIDSWYNRIVEI